MLGLSTHVFLTFAICLSSENVDNCDSGCVSRRERFQS